MWFNTKLKKKNDNLDTTKNFNFFLTKWQEKCLKLPFSPLFLEEILTKTKYCMALLIKSNKYLLAITIILD
jgi:hypothetical protein